MGEKPRLAVVGLGWWGGELVKAVRASGTAEIVACFARTVDSRKAFAAEQQIPEADSYESVLADPDVDGVLLATSHSSHAPLAVAAAGAGKHVFVEKPLTLTVEDARRCVQAAAKAGVVLQVGHNKRRQPANRRVKEMIDTGELGRVVAVEAHHAGGRGLSIDPHSWRADPAESPLSGMTGMGVHQIDNMHYLIGPIKRVAAKSNSLLKRTRLDDATVLVLEFENGVVGSLVTSYVAPPTVRSGVIGTKAAVWNDLDGKRLSMQTISEREPQPLEVAQLDTVADELAEFANCITTGATPETGGQEGLRVVAVLEAAVAAAASGQAVDVEDVG